MARAAIPENPTAASRDSRLHLSDSERSSVRHDTTRETDAAVPKITPDQASDMIKKGNTLVVDVRDAPEVSASGKIAGAVNVSRGMLEFRADPDSPYHDKNFDKEKTVILYCASGGRSALAGKVLKDMGYEKVYNVGGFKDWTGAVEKV
jgi:rhodanese-related sulfurtransferase